MSTPSRTWTLDQLRKERCTEVGECWEWNGCINSKGHPVMSYQGKNVLVRRLSFALKHGTEPSKLKAQRVWSTCCSQTCINPGCLRGGSHSNSFSAQAKMGLFKRSPAAKVSAAIAKRSVSDLDMGKVRDIRKAIEKGESVAVVARRYRKSHSLVRKIRDNECWREAAVGASVFHQVAA